MVTRGNHGYQKVTRLPELQLTDETEDEETRPTSSRTPTPPTKTRTNRYGSRRVRGQEEDHRPGARSRLWKRLLRESLEEEAKELRSTFQHRWA
jgi:hypothetical protein